MHRVYLGYMIMKIRMKISFEACIRKRTLQEHFFEAILTSYNQRREKGLIDHPWPEVTDSFTQFIKSCDLVAICKCSKKMDQSEIDQKCKEQEDEL